MENPQDRTPLASLCDRLRRPASRLLLLLLVAAAVRVVGLSSSPPGFFCDESALATNAWSIGLTGRDLGGTFLPLYCHEKSFERWNVTDITYQPVYLYSAVPLVRAFGPSPVVLRLTSVLFGLLGVAAVYLLGARLFEENVGLVAAAVLAVTPWHVHFSRVGFEAISLPALLALGSWALLRGLASPRFLVLGGGLLGLATFAYPTGKMIAPILMACFVVLHARTLRGCPKQAGLALALFSLLMVPHLGMVLGHVHQERLQRLLIVSADLANEPAVRFLRDRGPAGDALLGRRALLVPFTFLYNCLQYFSPSFLFLRGDPNLRHGGALFGPLYWMTIPLLLCGVVDLFRRRRDAASRFVLLWLLIYPVPASLTIETPHAIRSIQGLPVLALVAAVGWAALRRAASSATRPALAARALVFLVLLLGPFEVVFFLRYTLADYPKDSARAWQAGMVDGVRTLKAERAPGQVAYVTTRELNSTSFVILAGGVDVRTLAREGDWNERLRPFGYQLLFPDETARPRRGDLLLLTSEERGRYPGLASVAELPYPDGSPHLAVFRKVAD